MNVSDYIPNFVKISKIMTLLGQPNRVQILLAIGTGHACVCHLETVLGMRQAAISQQLMLLRKEGLVETEKIGRHVFYHLKDPRWLDLIDQAASILETDLPSITIPEIEGCEYTK